MGALIMGALTIACVEDPGAIVVIPRGNYDRFVETVQPVLADRCSQSSCHGTTGRPFWVYSVRDLRLGDASGPLSTKELEANHLCARSFLSDMPGSSNPADAAHPEDSALLTKPLAVREGGVRHASGPVFERRSEHGYAALLAWVQVALDEG
ncbi:MAG: hypothetical protein V3V08_20415 [Nannocystaceae bacterium]